MVEGGGGRGGGGGSRVVRGKKVGSCGSQRGESGGRVVEGVVVRYGVRDEGRVEWAAGGGRWVDRERRVNLS